MIAPLVEMMIVAVHEVAVIRVVMLEAVVVRHEKVTTQIHSRSVETYSNL